MAGDVNSTFVPGEQEGSRISNLGKKPYAADGGAINSNGQQPSVDTATNSGQPSGS